MNKKNKDFVIEFSLEELEQEEMKIHKQIERAIKDRTFIKAATHLAQLSDEQKLNITDKELDELKGKLAKESRAEVTQEFVKKSMINFPELLDKIFNYKEEKEND